MENLTIPYDLVRTELITTISSLIEFDKDNEDLIELIFQKYKEESSVL